MSAIEQRLSILEQKAANSKPVNLLDLLVSLEGDELLPIYSPDEGKLVKVSVQEFINATGIQNLSFNEIVHNQIITFDGTNFTYSPIVSFPNVVVNAGQLVFLSLNILDETDETLSKRLYLVEKPSGSYQFQTLINSGDILELKREQADPSQANTVTYTVTDLNEINTSNPALDFSDADLIYFVELDAVLYRFISTLGLYGLGELQMDMNDLIQVGSSQSNVVIDNALSTSSGNAIANSAVANEFVRTNLKVLELNNNSSDNLTTLASNYGFVRSITGTNTLELPTNNVSDFNLRGYVDAGTLAIDATNSDYTLIAPNGTTVNADENFALISLKTNVMLLVKYNLGSGGSGTGDMEASVYDPQNISADAFARDNHTGTQAISTVSGLQSELDTKLDKRTNKPISTGNYTLLASDADKFLVVSAPCEILVPNGFDEDLEFQGVQVGGSDTDVLKFVAQSGGTLNVPSVFQNKTENEHCFWGIRTFGSDVATLTGTLKLSV